MQVTTSPTRRKLGSRRLRRVVWAASTLAVLVLIGSIVAWRIHKENQPDEYTPGETSSDITSNLSERSKAAVEPASQTVKSSAPQRNLDSLRNPGLQLPQGAPEPRFTDVTEAAGLSAFRQFNGPRTSQLPEDMGSGVAWGDFDNDGFDDLFVVSGGGAMDLPPAQRASSVLYRNLGSDRFAKVEDFPELRILGTGAAWGDYDGDGWLDLVVVGYDTIILLRNDRGHFVRSNALPSLQGFWTGVSWGDYDRDGYLDLYICGYVKYIPGNSSESSKQFGLEVPYSLNPASFGPERNLLFHNSGTRTFTEVGRQLGVDNPEGRSLSALWHDFDNDGWTDLYVANDISENRLFLNRNGKFVDSGRDAWVEEYRGSMGLAAGDYDRDDDDDLFISHWIAQQYALYQSLLSEQKTPGNTPELHFTDVAAILGIGQSSIQSIGWGTSFVDFDSNGWLDLAVANGSTFEQKTSPPRQLVGLPSFLFWNAHGNFFYDLAPWNHSLSKPRVSRGLAVSDYNNDGAMDIAIVDHEGGIRLLRNDVPQGNWIELRLHSNVPGRRDAIGFGDGAVVTGWVGNVPQRRTVSSASYLSQDTHRVHIGIGAATKIDRLEVRWAKGSTDSWSDLAANHIWDLTQGHRQAKIFAPATPANDSARPQVQLDRASLLLFWQKQRAAMDAMKREGNLAKAITLFHEALAINPEHEDSHYYLANCLAATGDLRGATAELDELARISHHNHRAYQRKGELLAASASSRRELEVARQALESALRLNPEETGALALLGQVSLAMGDLEEAEQRLAHVCQANQKASSAWFLRGYIAWKRRDFGQATKMLELTRTARGKDWKPMGSVAEGDVKHQMFAESGFLNVFERQWDGHQQPAQAYSQLSSYLAQIR